MKNLKPKRLTALIVMLCVFMSAFGSFSMAYADDADVTIDAQEIEETREAPVEQPAEQSQPEEQPAAPETAAEQGEAAESEPDAGEEVADMEITDEQSDAVASDPIPGEEPEAVEEASGTVEEASGTVEVASETAEEEAPTDTVEVDLTDDVVANEDGEAGEQEALEEMPEPLSLFTAFGSNFDGVSDIEYFVGMEAQPLEVGAEVIPDAQLSWRWYLRDIHEDRGFEPVEDVQGNAYVIDTGFEQDAELYAEATATLGEISETRRTDCVCLSVRNSLLELLCAGVDYGSVTVKIENNTYPESEGAPWDGVLLNTEVTLNADSTMMSCIVDALEQKGYEQSGAENGYISTINGLSEFDGGGMSGWMGTLNDWFTNYGFGDFSVANGKLEDGDVIRVMYTCDFGEDLGGSWNNNDTRLKSLEITGGTLAPAFDSDTDAYTLTMDKGVETLIIVPTAMNKNYQTKIVADDVVYKSGRAISVHDGSALTISCGEGESMNAGEPTFYSVSVVAAGEPQEEPTEEITAYVSISHGGSFVTGQDGRPVAHIALTLESGATLDDALRSVHEACYDGGASGYASSYYEGSGTAITKLWGDDSGAFGYFHNGRSAWNLDEALADGDTVDAYIYADPINYSDVYTRFDPATVSAATGESISLTLLRSDYDESWNIVESPLAHAVISVDGSAIGSLTNSEGRVTLTFNEAGSYIVSALNPDVNMTAPVCAVTVTGEKKGEGGVEGSGDPYAPLSSLIIHTGTAPSKTTALVRNAGDTSYVSDTCEVFDPAKHAYTLSSVLDSETQLRFRALADKTVVAWNGGSKDITWKSGTSKYAACITPGHNSFTLTASAEGKDDNVYTFTIDVIPTLTGLAARDGGAEYYLDKTFAAATGSYTVTIPEDLGSLTLNATPKNDAYTVLYNGSAQNVIDVSDPSLSKIDIVVSTADGLTNGYELNIDRVAAKTVTFSITPEEAADARVIVKDSKGTVVTPDEQGVYSLMLDSYAYTYTVSKYGYVVIAGTVPAEGGAISVALVPNADNDLEDVGSEWSSFRGEDNMGITDVQTPDDPATTELLWNAKLGTGWTASPSVQIIVDNALIVMSGKLLYKLDLKTGEILAQADMVDSPSYGYTPPTYADGMIFCPLGNGTIQAFNAKTLESLWVYRDPLKGQALSPITYSDGYVYTGFWTGENKDADYVCISAADDSAVTGDTSKQATWSLKQTGGFYWAGSLVKGNTVIVVTDDGDSSFSGDAHLYSMDKRTGDIISDILLEGMGDARSSVAWNEKSGRVCFSTKGGYLCSAKLDVETGRLSDLRSSFKDAQSTSTPLIYGDRIYYAVGTGISASGSAGSFVVADADTLETLYKVDLKGYPQNSMLLSTAYVDSEGYLYFYSTYNANPGGISLVRVRADGTGSAVDAEVIEIYDAKGFEQYCIASIICSEDGVLYYKNDSGNVLAVGTTDVGRVERAIRQIGTVTTGSVEAVAKARAAYLALSEEDRAKVTNLNVLEDAEAALVAAVVEAIDAIGEVTFDNLDSVQAVRDLVDALPETLKADVSNIDVLKQAEARRDYLLNECVEMIPGKTVSLTLRTGDQKELLPGKGYTVKSWASSNKKVATVSSAGLVNAVAAGSANITMTDKKGKKATLKLNVVPVAEGIDAPDTLTLGVGNTVSIAAAIVPAGAGGLDAVVTEGSAVSLEGMALTGLEAGEAVVTLTSTQDASIAKAIRVTVLPAPESLTLSTHSITLGIGESFTLTAGTDSGADPSARFTTDSKLIKLTADGVVTGSKKTKTPETVTATSYNGKTDSCEVSVVAAPTSIKLNATKLTLPIDPLSDDEALRGYGFTYTLKPADTHTTLEWSSSDDSVATVDQNGHVTFVAPGTVTITVKTYNAKVKASCKLTLQSAPTDIVNLGGAVPEVMLTGETYSFKTRLEPANAYGSVSITSSDPAVLAIKNGKITAKKSGEATITLSAFGISRDYPITVYALPTKVTASCTSMSLGFTSADSCETGVLSFTTNANEEVPEFIREVRGKDFLTVTSSSEKVATVEARPDGSYLIVPHKTGSATITAKTVNGKKASCKVSVKKAPASIKLGSAPKLGVGLQGTIKATLSSGSASSLKWSSSDESILTVDNGTITAVGAGTAKVTATAFNGVSASCDVTIAPAPSELILSANALTLKKGKSATLKATFDSGSIGICTLESSDSAIVSVKGMKLTAMARGEAVITAATQTGVTAICKVTVK